ncbi:hypothetical protein E4T56_gene8873 [Termitomyces sp. T112]|nr:hypothetical protein E4T56_gene8873 [Termitomyces sp. T112]
MRLAWWRDRLRDSAANWPKGEPLLAALTCWGDEHGALVALVDGWEALLGEAPLPVDAFEAWINGRVAACVALHEGAAGMARGWALSDLASHLGDAQEQAVLADLIDAHMWRATRLPRAMRPLAVLHGLAAKTRGPAQGYSSGPIEGAWPEGVMGRIVIGAVGALALVGAGFFWWQGRAGLEKAAPLRYFVKGHPMAAWGPGLEPFEDELVIPKQYPSAFFGTSLASTLTAMGVDSVLLTGLSTSGCVRASCVDAMSHGFKTAVIADACGDRHSGPHDANLFDMNAKYADPRAPWGDRGGGHSGRVGRPLRHHRADDPAPALLRALDEVLQIRHREAQRGPAPQRRIAIGEIMAAHAIFDDLDRAFHPPFGLIDADPHRDLGGHPLGQPHAVGPACLRRHALRFLHRQPAQTIAIEMPGSLEIGHDLGGIEHKAGGAGHAFIALQGRAHPLHQRDAEAIGIAVHHLAHGQRASW